MTICFLEVNYTKTSGDWHCFAREKYPLAVVFVKADEIERGFKEGIKNGSILEYHIYITEADSEKRLEHRSGRKKRSAEEKLNDLFDDEFYKKQIKSGKMLVLPFGRDAEIYHVTRSKSKFGKVIWRARRVSYEYMAMVIARDGDDNLWCNGLEEAKKACKTLAETFGGSTDSFPDRFPEAGLYD